MKTVEDIIESKTFVKDGLITVELAAICAEEYASQFKQPQLPIGEEVKPLTTSIKEEKVSTGLDELIEWINDWESSFLDANREDRFFQGAFSRCSAIKQKVKEIKSRLNK